VDVPRFPPVPIPLRDLKIDVYDPPVTAARRMLRVTHLPTGFQVASIHLNREQLIALIAISGEAQTYYASTAPQGPPPKHP
jgi:hypothetical protein